MIMQLQLNGQHSNITHTSLNSVHVTQNHHAGHCSGNDLDGVNEKELTEKKLRKVGPN